LLLEQLLEGVLFAGDVVLVELVLFHDLEVVALELPENVQHCVLAIRINVPDLDFFSDRVVRVLEFVEKVAGDKLAHGLERLHMVDFLPQELAGHHCGLLELADFLHFAQAFLHLEGVEFLELNRIDLIVKIEILPEFLLVDFVQFLLHILFLLLLNQVLLIGGILLLHLLISEQLFLFQQRQVIKIVLDAQGVHLLAQLFEPDLVLAEG
jgi:hypothetical protein